MTGAQLAAYVQRRLAEYGLDVEASRTAEIYDAITEGRDMVIQALALAAPLVVQQLVTLEVDAVDDRLYSLPAATPDPLRVVEVRPVETGIPLELSQTLNSDGADYVWVSPRELRLADHAAAPGGLEGLFVLHAPDVDAATAEADIGAPTPTHRAIGKAAAVLLLSANEESDARLAMGLLQRELDALERIYGEYDMGTGSSLRAAMLASYGEIYGDMIL